MNKLVKQAFTLIELLVVIAIIGILSGLIVVSMSGLNDKANVAKAKIFENSLKNSLMLNMVGEWKFDELTTVSNGTTIRDSWNGKDGTMVTDNGTAEKLSSDCVSGKCINFDGTGDYIDGGISTNQEVINALTISAWVRSTNTAINYQGIVRKGAVGNGYHFMFYDTTRRICLYAKLNGTWSAMKMSTKTLDNNVWYNVAVTYDGAKVNFYINGAADVPTNMTGDISGEEGQSLIIGRSEYGSMYLNGTIDDVRVYNIAMPTSQIKEQYYIGLNSLLISGQIDKGEYQERVAMLK